MIVDLPDPEGAEKMITLASPVLCGVVILSVGFIIYRYYITFSTCSLICSSSSFICTTIFCISAWFDLLPSVLISRPIS